MKKAQFVTGGIIKAVCFSWRAVKQAPLIVILLLHLTGCQWLPPPPADPTLSVQPTYTAVPPIPTLTPKAPAAPDQTPTLVTKDRLNKLEPPGFPGSAGVYVSTFNPAKINIAEFAATIQKIRQSGFSAVRIDLPWFEVEKQKGAYDFKIYDSLLAPVFEQKMQLVLTIGYGNSLYDSGMAPATPEARAAFAAFAGAAAQHYKNRAIYWEIWNEPNADYYWTPAPDARNYALLATDTINTIYQSNSEAVIIGPALQGFDWGYLDKLGQMGLLSRFEAISIHPTREAAPETTRQDLLNLRILLEKYTPGAHQPIVASRWGYSRLWKEFNETKQALFMSRQWLSAIENELLYTFWQDWQDPEEGGGYAAQNFGLLHANGSAWQALDTFQNLSSLLDGSLYLRSLATSKNSDHILLFKGKSGVILAAWTERIGHPVLLPIPCSQVISTMLDGKAKTLRGAKNNFSVDLLNTPQFIQLCDTPETQQMAAWRLPSSLVYTQLSQESVLPVVINPETAQTAGKIRLTAAGKTLAELALDEKTASSQIELSIPQPDWDASILPAELTWPNAQKTAPSSARLWLLLSNAYKISFLPNAGNSLNVTIEDPLNRSGDYQLELMTGKESQTQKFSLAAHQVQTITFENIPGLTKNTAYQLNLLSSGGELLQTYGPFAWTWIDKTFNRGNWRVSMDGPIKAPSAASAAAVDIPQPFTQTDLKTMLQISHRTGIGWRSVHLTPPIALNMIPGKPKAIGFWLFGKQTQDSLNCSFIDSTNQHFTPIYGPVSWSGWKFVTLPLNGENTLYFGGANDGNVYYPIRWENIFSLDLAEQFPSLDNRLYVTGFVYLY
jgi:aryl-phospho-beta-D-glucosidase BglC (GH1 family)